MHKLNISFTDISLQKIIHWDQDERRGKLFIGMEIQTNSVRHCVSIN